MGLPMALKLHQAGHAVLGVDVAEDCLELARARGLEATTWHDIHPNQDVIITMLPTGKHLLEVIAALYPKLKADTLHLDCSTIGVDEARQMHEAAKEHGILCLDAPVSGGVMGAEKGSLTFMVGGTGAAYDQASSLFEIMGQKSVLCGAAGAGQAVKACNNMLLAISMIGVSEAFILAEKLGLSPEALFEVSSQSSGQCWSLNTYCPVPDQVEGAPSNNNYQPGFSAALMLKDLLLAQSAAEQNHAITPLGAQALSLYQQMVEAGHGDKDFSGIIQHLQ